MCEIEPVDDEEIGGLGPEVGISYSDISDLLQKSVRTLRDIAKNDTVPELERAIRVRLCLEQLVASGGFLYRTEVETPPGRAVS